MPISFSDPLGTSTYYTPSGIKGDPGPAGPRGIQGVQGPTGSQGPTGVEGPRGLTGLTGERGVKGDKGDTGIQGPAGPQGDQGERGLTGAQGPQGSQGAAGLTGAAGATGSQGIRGMQGAQGPQGPKGDQGVRGPAGATGIIWRGNWSNSSDYVNNDAVFHNSTSWFASNDPAPGDVPSLSSSVWFPLALQGATGATGATGPQGIQGVIGATGPQGIQGETGPEPWTLAGVYDNGADYALGDAVTYEGGFYYRTGNPLNPGYPPTPGSINASWTPIADRGATGATGATGADSTVAGPQGPQGATGATGPQGATGADSTVPGPTGPTGPTGATGPQGPAGVDATLVQVISDKSANYTLQASDKFALIRSTNAAINITVPDVLTIGDRVDVLQDGAGQVTFVASGVTLQAKGAKLKTAAQYSAVTLVKVAATQYRLIGDLG